MENKAILFVLLAVLNVILLNQEEKTINEQSYPKNLFKPCYFFHFVSTQFADFALVKMQL